MTNELKPCPFCGGVGYQIDCSITRNPWWVVTCRDCGAHGSKWSSKILAIEAWNIRYEQTCKNAYNSVYRFKCSECDILFETEHMYFDIWYCPNCGARVSEDD